MMMMMVQQLEDQNHQQNGLYNALQQGHTTTKNGLWYVARELRCFSWWNMSNTKSHKRKVQSSTINPWYQKESKGYFLFRNPTKKCLPQNPHNFGLGRQFDITLSNNSFVHILEGILFSSVSQIEIVFQQISNQHGINKLFLLITVNIWIDCNVWTKSCWTTKEKSSRRKFQAILQGKIVWKLLASIAESCLITKKSNYIIRSDSPIRFSCTPSMKLSDVIWFRWLSARENYTVRCFI